MAKKINRIVIQIDVTRDELGEIVVSEMADLTIGADEYPEFESRKGIPITLTPTQETAIINHIKNVVLPQAELNK